MTWAPVGTQKGHHVQIGCIKTVSRQGVTQVAILQFLKLSHSPRRAEPERWATMF
jgi:hypothetical protein